MYGSQKVWGGEQNGLMFYMLHLCTYFWRRGWGHFVRLKICYGGPMLCSIAMYYLSNSNNPPFWIMFNAYKACLKINAANLISIFYRVANSCLSEINVLCFIWFIYVQVFLYPSVSYICQVNQNLMTNFDNLFCVFRT